MKMRIILFYCLLLGILSGCTNPGPAAEDPPYNDFDQSSNVPKAAAAGAVSGAIVGAAFSPLSSGATALIGASVQAASTATKESSAMLLQQLPKEHIQVVQEGKRITLIIPADKYYLFDSYELNDIAYPGLEYTVKLILKDSTGMIHIAGFTDDGVGARTGLQKLSQERAQSMADFLWANGIPLDRMTVIGYGPRYDVADNHLIHGAAMNRRVEIQWDSQCCPPLSGNLCKDR